MYVLALSDYSTISRYLQHAAAAGYKPAPQLDKIPVQHLKILTYFYHRRFLFHVSFFTFNKVIINDFKR